jgi:DMSO reductase family type II enzyme heme b subunit
VLKPAAVQGDVVTLQAWPYQGAPALDLCYWSARRGETIEAVAESYERAASAAQPALVLHGAARYDDGRWQLVIQRPLAPAVEGTAEISRDVFTPVAFVIWDGGNPGARAISPWIDIALAGGAPASAHAALGQERH